MIEKGKLASPGAICDFKKIDSGWKSQVLDDELIVKDGNTVDPVTGKFFLKGLWMEHLMV